jgi:hypothetical protein
VYFNRECVPNPKACCALVSSDQFIDQLIDQLIDQFIDQFIDHSPEFVKKSKEGIVDG